VAGKTSRRREAQARRCGFGPEHVVFHADGSAHSSTRDGDSVLTLLNIDGSKANCGPDSLRPAALRLESRPTGGCVVANIGRNLGDPTP